MIKIAFIFLSIGTRISHKKSQKDYKDKKDYKTKRLLRNFLLSFTTGTVKLNISFVTLR